MFPHQPDGDDAGCTHEDDVGPYLLGALGPAEAQLFEDHLPGCVSCRTTLERLGHLPGLLATLTTGQGVALVDDSIPQEETVAFRLTRDSGPALTPPRQQRRTPRRSNPPKPPAAGPKPG